MGEQVNQAQLRDGASLEIVRLALNTLIRRVDDLEARVSEVEDDDEAEGAREEATRYMAILARRQQESDAAHKAADLAIRVLEYAREERARALSVDVIAWAFGVLRGDKDGQD